MNLAEQFTRDEAPQEGTLVDQIVHRLQDEIITGSYLPGDRLKEQELALRLGTSRGPLREALRVLEREGLVEILPWRGAQVKRPTPDEIRELFDARAEMFGMCARRAAAGATKTALDAVRRQIAELIDATEAGCDEKSYKVMTNAIAIQLSAMIENRYLHEIMQGLRQRMFWYYCYLGTSTLDRRRDSNQSWKALSEALRKREEQQAEQAARRIVATSGEFALKALVGAGQIDPGASAAPSPTANAGVKRPARHTANQRRKQ